MNLKGQIAVAFVFLAGRCIVGEINSSPLRISSMKFIFSVYSFSTFMRPALLSVMLFTLSACISAPSDPGLQQKAAYAMPDKYSAMVVDRVLRDGGNAVDASIAAAFVLAVTFPEAGNIGGGGFMLTHMNGKQNFLDYREKAPLSATRDMYLDTEGNVMGRSSLIGIRAAGVPGTVAGLWSAHQKYATKPWGELIEPAILLASQGFEVHSKKSEGMPEIIEWFSGEVNFSSYFGKMKDGGVFKQPELAETLRRIQRDGRQGFYQGETANLLVQQMQRDGGLISHQDLSNYQSVWRKPLLAQWRNYTVVSAPPPSSGGFAVIQLLKMKELLGKEFAGLEVNSPQYVHLIAEMEKRVFADRAKYFGDPDFTDVPINELISDPYIARRAGEVNVNGISNIEHVRPGLESPNTTHYSIMDQWGNAVSNTYTLNWAYGSGVVVEGAGFILNNEMDDFSTKPGVANVYGAVGGKANEIQPSKRMLSSMSPTLLLSDNNVEMVIGTPGGTTIFTGVFQCIVNVIDYGMTPKQSVATSRFHHQLLPPELITMSVSLPLSEETQAELKKRGYRVTPHEWEFGDVQLIEQTTGVMRTGSDPRGIGVSGVIH